MSCEPKRMRRGLRAPGLACLSLGAVMMAALPAIAKDGSPDFGPNVAVFSPSMPPAAMQAQIDRVYATQQHNEFGPQRNAFLFLPGEYKLDVPVGYYTQVVGLGASPDQVHITGNVHVDAALGNNNATTTFWRTAEGFSVTPTDGTLQWATSQAIAFRRMHVRGNMVLHQEGGWASGGWMSDTVVDDTVGSGSQQQWISRNVEWKGWTGSNWNMVFVGVQNPPSGQWPQPPYTTVAQTPVIREKPFLQVDAAGRYSVRVPALRKNSVGVTWHGGSTPGRSIPLGRFYLARPGQDSAATLNAALKSGKNLLLLPGIYDLTAPLAVTRANTVVLGLGYATLHPVQGTAALIVADVDGVSIASVLIDAGETISPVLMQVGRRGSRVSHANNPISLHDIYFRVGGAGVGNAGTCLQVDSNDTLIDHTWIWRADHGKGVGWTSNASANGLVVHSDNVIAYGLFVEHHQQFQVLWEGNGGRTYFYQSEIPYDPPTQAQYTSAPGVNGWASYKVGDAVTSHEAWGLGIYSVFRQPNVTLSRAIEAPKTPGVRFHHMISVALGNLGEITNVINDTGGATVAGPKFTPKVTDYP